ncbi:MAG: acyl-phosphate glycerol 3-phosphate acyltransferase [Deltaproteobacteria bacterium]|nr:MAG: acyl-phosphate glycerol 3-phosphate acyltransferase [Deltaproteobacteria bacterium]
MILNLLLMLFSYLLGSIPTGLLVSKAFAKVDPRQSGSRNIGATNVLRAAGKTLGGITLAGDLLKGLIPVLVALWLRGGEMWIAAVALGAFLGHLFPLYLRFKGGKGVATALGIYIPLVPLAILFNLFVFAAGVAISRTVSVGSLSAAAAMPILIWLWGYPKPYLILGLIVGGLIFYRHRENIKRLLRGQENKIWGRS